MQQPSKNSRPPLQRMVRIHMEIRAGKMPNCRSLSADLEVATKTIQRDIDFMRDQLGLPIAYDPVRFGFHYTEPVAQFPGMEVTEGEIVALFVAQKALLQYHGTTYEKPLRAAFQKITSGLDQTIQFDWADVDTALSFRSIGQSESDIALFETVSKAVLRSEELDFAYKKLKSEKFEDRRVQPYHLACIEQQWYLFAFDLARSQMRTFALPRMRKARLTKRRFSRPADFSIATHLQGSFGVFNPGTTAGTCRVVIEFDSFAARLVAERQWHASQMIEELPDGRLRLTLELSTLAEIERWVLGWGVHARVVAPPELAGHILEQCQAMARQYAPNGEKP